MSTVVNTWTANTSITTATINSKSLALSNGVFVLTTGNGLDTAPYYSTDSGVTWNLAVVASDWISASYTSAFAQTTNGTLYLAINTGSSTSLIFKSTDSGHTYQKVAELATGVTSLVSAGNTLFAYAVDSSTTYTLWKCTDSGITWTSITNPNTGIASQLTYHAGYLFCTPFTSGGSSFRSADYGVTWTNILGSEPISFVGFTWHDSTHSYMSIYNTTTSTLGVLVSADSFETATGFVANPDSIQGPITSAAVGSNNVLFIAAQYSPGQLFSTLDQCTTLVSETPTTSDFIFMIEASSSAIVALAGSTLYVGSTASPAPSAPDIAPTTELNPSPLTVTLTCATTGASIYYTVDGSEPTSASTLYTAPFQLAFSTPTTCAVKAVAVASGVSSAITSKTYRIGQQVAAPVITGTADAYGLGYMSVSIADATTNASIYYTVDGSSPTTASMPYTGPFTIFEATNNIKAIALCAGYFDSDVTSVSLPLQRTVSDYPTVGPYLSASNSNPVESATRTLTVGSSVTVDMVSTATGRIDYATIHYTLDGSTPTTSSPVYSTPLTVSSTCTLKAIAVKGTQTPLQSSVTTITYVFEAATLSKPAALTLSSESFTLASGAVTTTSPNPVGAVSAVFMPDYGSGSGAVAIAVNSIGADTPGYIYFCDPVTREPFKRVSISATCFGCQALAYDADTKTLYAAVDTATAPALYSINVTSSTSTKLCDLQSEILLYLVFNNVDRCLYGFDASNRLLKYSVTSNALTVIRSNASYKVDFCDPVSGKLYGHSYSTTGMYEVDPALGTGTQVLATTIQYDRIIHDNVGAKTYGIKYTTTQALAVYSLDVANQTEAELYTVALTRTVGDVIIAGFAMIPAPVASVPGGTYQAAQSVTLTCSAATATIHYTLDGSTPTAASTAYATPVQIAASSTLKAIAVSATGESLITTEVYIISTTVPTPSILPDGGSYAESVDVQITCSQAGASIYYTIDGTAPTTASTTYTGTITLAKNTTVKAIAAAAGSSNSAIASADFLVAAAAPVFSLAAGNYAPGIAVAITCATPGATVHYTVDGTVPTTASSIYSAQILIQKSTTLRAIAYTSGMQPSSVTTTTYKIAHDILFCASWSGSSFNSLGYFQYGSLPGYIYRVDTSTATQVKLAQSTARLWTGLAFSKTNKALYACTSVRDSGLIYRIDIGTGAETPITTTSRFWRGLVYDDTTDALYGCVLEDTTLETGYIYKVDVATGTESKVGSTSAPWRGITVNPATGILYACIDYSENLDATRDLTGIYAIDAVSGTVTCINEYDRIYRHITYNAADSRLYIALDGGIYRLATNGYGFSEVTVLPQLPSIDFSSNTQTLISSDLRRGTDGSVENVITYMDIPNKRLMDVTLVTSTAGEFFQSCASVGLVETPEPDVASGVYTEPQQIHLFCDTDGAVIHYTLDGSEPTSSSPVYTGPITIG